MHITELLVRYSQAVECSPRYLESLRRTTKKLESSGMVNVCQLHPDPVNKFLAELPLSHVTRANIRRELLTLWRYAHEEGLTEVHPSRIRRIKVGQKPPTCWTRDELQALYGCAKKDEARISKRLKELRRCDVIPAWIGVGFEAGLRFGDVHALHADMIRNGCIVSTAAKTGKMFVRVLSPTTIKAVNELLARSPDGTVFRWCLPRRRAVRMWRDFLRQHGFSGSSKWLRRAAATQSEMLEAGSASRFLQHSYPQLAARHYIDASQLSAPIGPRPLD